MNSSIAQPVAKKERGDSIKRKRSIPKYVLGNGTGPVILVEKEKGHVVKKKINRKTEKTKEQDQQPNIKKRGKGRRTIKQSMNSRQSSSSSSESEKAASRGKRGRPKVTSSSVKEQTLLQKMRQHARISRKKQIKSNFYLQRSDYLKWGVPIGTKGMKEQFEELMRVEKERERQRKKRDKELIRELSLLPMRRKEEGVKIEEVKKQEEGGGKQVGVKREEDETRISQLYSELVFSQDRIDFDKEVIVILLQKIALLYDLTEPVYLEGSAAVYNEDDKQDVKCQEKDSPAQNISEEKPMKEHEGEIKLQDSCNAKSVPQHLSQQMRPNRSDTLNIFKDYQKLIDRLLTSNSSEARHIHQQLLALSKDKAQQQAKSTLQLVKAIRNFINMEELTALGRQRASKWQIVDKTVEPVKQEYQQKESDKK